jgi:uncharacterized protein
MARGVFAAVLLACAVVTGPGSVSAQAPAAPPAAAVNPKAEALVRRYLAAIHFEQLLDTMMGSMIPLMTDNLSQQYPSLTAEQREEIGVVVRDTMREDFTPKMLARMVPIYAQTFSVSELEAMVAFYESPAGQTIMKKTPGLAPKSAEVARELLPGMQKDVVARLCAKVDCFGGKAQPPPKPRPS